MKKAREQIGITRKKLCEKLNTCKTSHPEKEITEDVLKMWELGTNSINIEWIPAICVILNCDVGYLFGAYAQKTKESSDVQHETGLSDEAIQKLQMLSSGVHLREQNIWGELASEYLDFYSFLISDAEMAGVLLSYFGTMGSIDEQGLSEAQDRVFDGSKEQAIAFYRFEATQAILRVMEKYYNTKVLRREG